MKCPKCNQIVADGSRFCEFCGVNLLEALQEANAPQPETVQQTPAPQPEAVQGYGYQEQGIPQGNAAPQQVFSQQTPAPRKPLNLWLIIGVAAAVVVVILIIIIAATHKKKIDLTDYTEVVFSGYDKYGTAYIDFDEEALFEDIQKYAKNIKTSSDSTGYDWSDLLSDLGSWSSYYVICADLDWELDVSSGLSNGDTVTVSYQYDNDVAKKYGIKFAGKDMEFTVDGLSATREVDPFEDITVTFSGTAPDVYAQIQNNSSDEAVRDLYFSMDKSSGISKGDIITVTVETDPDYLLEYYGCVLTVTSKEFTCEEVDAYIMDGSDIGDTVLGQMKQQTEDTIEAYFAQNADSISVSGLSYVGYYFLSVKDETSWRDKNIVYVVFSGSVSSVDEDGFETTDVYFPVCFENVIKYADGTDYVDLTNTYIEGSTSLSYGWWSAVSGYESLTAMKNELVTSQKGDYNDSVYGDLE